MAADPTVRQVAAVSRWRSMSGSSLTKLAVAGLAIALVISAFCAAGGFQAAHSVYRRITGETILVDKNTKSFGVVAPGDPVSVTFRLTNSGPTPVRIAGCEAGCACIMPAELPFVLNPHETRDFPISIHNPNREEAIRSGPLSVPLRLFTTNPAQPRVGLTIQGEIRRASVLGASRP